MSKFRFWFNNARPTSLPQSLLPAILAACLASSTSTFSLLLAILSILGVMFGHLGLNLFDDYFDYKKMDSSYRDRMAHNGMRARIGKCAYLTSGEATPKELLIACCTFSGIALVIGLLIVFISGNPKILYFAVATAILGISYSGAPLRLSYRGLGELLIGTVFGPLVILGTYYASCGTLNIAIVLFSISIGFLVSNIIYVHSILDFAPDKQIGKQTLAVKLDNPKLMLVAQAVILLAPYLIIALGVLSGYIAIGYLFVFLTLPLALYLFYLMVLYIKKPEQQVDRRWWMGPMTNWSRVQKMGIEWFMIRWLLARNLLTFFCLIVIVLNFTI